MDCTTGSGNPESCIESAYEKGLYNINPINKAINRQILSLAYSPGVGDVCKAIEKNPQLVDSLTLRGRSVAVVTQGNTIKDDPIEPGRMMPIVDWVIAQLKFYGQVDAFPFILRKEANVVEALNDISNSYALILLLDPIKLEADQLPKDTTVLYLHDVLRVTKSEKHFDCKQVSYVVANALQKKKRGLLSDKDIEEGVEVTPRALKKNENYFIKMKSEKPLAERAIAMHEEFNGKIQIELNFINIEIIEKFFTEEDLISFVKNNTTATKGYTRISAIITDGTAILGFGDIGPRAGLPVMEGKSLLFQALGGVNIVPICINKRKTPEETVEAILDLTSYYKSINLEDIRAPECFVIEETLSKRGILPVFHDDQHGTAIVTLAALINAAKVRKTAIEELKVIVNGAGAAGITIAKLLMDFGVKDLIICDSKGAIYEGRKQGMNDQKEEVAKKTNKQNKKGNMEEVLEGCDVFIGVSVAGALKKEWVAKMNKDPIIFAMANPDPEISPDEAREAGCLIYGSGRSDYPNQINNSLVFPGIFRGIHTHNLPAITNEMKLATAELIADSMGDNIDTKNVIPDSLDRDVAINVAEGLEKYKQQ